MALVLLRREGQSAQRTNEAEERLKEGAATGPCL